MQNVLNADYKKQNSIPNKTDLLSKGVAGKIAIYCIATLIFTDVTSNLRGNVIISKEFL